MRWFPACSLVLVALGSAGALPAPASAAKDSPKTVSAVLRAKSEMPTLKGIAPYRDALVVHEYALEDGGQTLHVAHWAIVDALPQPSAKRKIGETYKMTLRPVDQYPAAKGVKTSNTLDNFDAAVWVQTDQSLKLRKLSADEYGRGLTDRMRTLHALRGQLKLLVWGDSRTDQGLDAGAFFANGEQADQDTTIPRAYNLAVQSSGLDTLEWLIDHYVPHLPELEWMVVGLDARMVAESWTGRELAKIKNSPAWRNDLKSDFAAWRNPSAVELTLAQIRSRKKTFRWDAYCWGGYDDKKGRLTMKAARRQIRHKDRNPHWALDVADWLQWKRILEKLHHRKINVLVFTPPTHPAFSDARIYSEDGISQKGYREFVGRLQRLRKQFPRLFVLDVNRGARHGLPAKYFADLDHLNHDGRDVLSRKIEVFRRKCKPRRASKRNRSRLDADGKLAPKSTPEGCEWGRLAKGAKIYTDRRYTLKAVPDELAGGLLLRTRNDDKTVSADEQRMTLRFDGPARVWLAFSEKDDLPQWAVQWNLSSHRLATDNGEYILIRRDTRRGWGKLNGPATRHANYFVIARPIAPADR
jgi:hypothetical protein